MQNQHQDVWSPDRKETLQLPGKQGVFPGFKEPVSRWEVTDIPRQWTPWSLEWWSWSLHLRSTLPWRRLWGETLYGTQENLSTDLQQATWTKFVLFWLRRCCGAWICGPLLFPHVCRFAVNLHWWRRSSAYAMFYKTFFSAVCSLQVRMQWLTTRSLGKFREFAGPSDGSWLLGKFQGLRIPSSKLGLPQVPNIIANRFLASTQSRKKHPHWPLLSQ